MFLPMGRNIKLFLSAAETSDLLQIVGTTSYFGETESRENTRRDFSKRETFPSILFVLISFIKILIAKTIRTKLYKPIISNFEKTDRLYFLS
ncbi:hypothetical protein LEP1GSC161_2884 [Leptospira santarosai str. CBC1416]|uniref:Uncharacterized protein n=2 Tax=Leptospira santarosai TaxID=28183 RepID=M6US60_9LEPT|nr:hypothetical protein B2G51_02060 [Leptospira santarosai]EMO47440.1 hypothetical protein LEP1GSC187_1407 [Leptospira santarosai str. ZUN179]EMO57342.1 hypothetical protein LEP1GSC161_2884 [Leptospira santarosai str. CBC1416]OLY60335.1 hypothetical protein BV917_11210 [Leptospira santarosai serovar Guaricura]OLY63420.1 hypothetical protein BWD11_14510 [Leptospira santarosai serovar Grippotyphosa]ONF76335.1 hypothetical protein BWD12_18640 [Leptospira santarosai serovar Bananal]